MSSTGIHRHFYRVFLSLLLVACLLAVIFIVSSGTSAPLSDRRSARAAGVQLEGAVPPSDPEPGYPASTTVLATAGYQIPLGLNSSNVHWLASNLSTGAQLQVTIPFSGGAQAAGNAQVALSQVSVSEDLTNLILTGQVTNLGSQPLVVAETAVSLRTDDGSVYLLLSTNPAFPWTVGPGQSVPFVVTFQRPMTVDTAVFTVLNQPFQLTNLR